jgi:hypothetical protein
MTLSEASTKITELTNADTAAYPAANRLLNFNLWNDLVHIEILKSQDEWDYDDSNHANYPIIYTNIVKDQQDYKLLSVDPGVLKINRVQVSDGTTVRKAIALDLNEFGGAYDNETLGNYFHKAKPYYEIKANSIFLYPIPDANVTAGLKVWIDRNGYAFSSAEWTTGTKTPGYDRQFHAIPVYGAAFEFLVSNSIFDKANFLKARIEEDMQRLREHYSSKVKDRKLVITPLNVNYE